MKRVLIISPYFPPSNAADSQRIRMSLNYFKDFSWEPVVMCVDPRFSNMVKDNLLMETISADIQIIKIKALPEKLTRLVALGSLALRSMFSYKNAVNALLKKQHFDLIYFSTTQFPICILGTYWKKRFGIPFIIDMQDPWHSDYYLTLPRIQRPRKFWFSYRLNKFLEPLAMKAVDGIISVSQNYIEDLQNRYKRLNEIPCKVITFGALELDFEIAKAHSKTLKMPFTLDKNCINLVYAGRGGHDMEKALELLFSSFKKCLKENHEYFSKMRFYFVGTSYAPAGTGKKTIIPIAHRMEIEEYVEESTDRISYFEALNFLLRSDGLIIPGSNASEYTASKIFPYILAKKPLLTVFYLSGSVSHIIRTTNAGLLADLNGGMPAEKIIQEFLTGLSERNNYKNNTDWEAFHEYSAHKMAQKQAELFEKVVDGFQTQN